MTIPPSVAAPTGLHLAIGRYGRPREWQCAYRVGREDIDYRRTVAARRSAEVVLALCRPGGRVVLHTKAFYPAGAYRLLTGGVQPGGDLLEAVRREAREETGLDVTIERFLGIIHHRFTHGQSIAPLDSYVFSVDGPGGALRPEDVGERISGYREVPVADLPGVARHLQALPAGWLGWGRFRAVPHLLVYEALAAADAGPRDADGGVHGG